MYMYVYMHSNLDHFEALARLIELNRRAGQLEKSEPFLEQASKVCARSAYEPGLNYCRGLFKRYVLIICTVYSNVAGLLLLQ